MKKERKDYILEKINNENKVKASDIVKEFNVTMETVRRDLEEMESQGLLRKVYGGAIKGKVYGPEPSYSTRMISRLEEKRAIAEVTCQLISEKEIVYIDGGTTTFEVAKKISENNPEIVAITNSLPVAEVLNAASNIQVVFLGGTLTKDDMVVTDVLNSNLIDIFHFHTTILGAASISKSQGVTDFTLSVTALKRKIIEKSEKVIIVADHSKFNDMIQYVVAKYDEIDYLITDKETSKEDIEICERAGINVLVGGEK